MKVSELIDILKKMNPDAEVWSFDQWGDSTRVLERTVTVEKDGKCYITGDYP